MKKSLLLLFTALLGFSSCKKEAGDGLQDADPKLANELRASPDTVLIAGNKLILTSYLWRDFMPIAEENGSKLLCVSMLADVDSVSLTKTIKLVKHYVLYGDEIWTADYSDIRQNFDFVLEGFVKDGPKWGPKVSVDVVCEFENSGTRFRIIAKSQEINRTE